jgi:hypothetical protein
LLERELAVTVQRLLVAGGFVFWIVLLVAMMRWVWILGHHKRDPWARILGKQKPPENGR